MATHSKMNQSLYDSVWDRRKTPAQVVKKTKPHRREKGAFEWSMWWAAQYHGNGSYSERVRFNEGEDEVPPHYFERSDEERLDESVWNRRHDDEKADLECYEHVRHSRRKHFSRKTDDKKVLKKMRRSAWINKKASKKRRR